jgi:hypothetical protein
MEDRGELFEILTEDYKDEHHKLVEAFGNRDNDRTAILTAHLISERLLEGMIETMLMHPSVWLKGTDYRSKTNLAYALGLIGDLEFVCCKVLNRCRNSIAHDLEPLPDKWRLELERLTKKEGERKGWKHLEPGLIKSLFVLLATISHAWTHAKFNQNWKQLRQAHGDRWIELYTLKMKDAEQKNLGVLDEINFSYETDLELAREVQQQRNLEKTKSST